MSVLGRLRSEYLYLTGALRALSRVTKVARNPQRTFPDIAESLAAEHGDRLALVSETERLTYAEYNARANQYARWAMANGIAKGDCIALMMPNRAEYMAAWLGMARAGAVVALVNTNLRGEVLAHCVNLVTPKLVVVDAPLLDAFQTASGFLDEGPTYWSFGADRDGWARLDPVLAETDGAAVPAGKRPTLTTADRCLYIYTSGTTGLPKAANINHYRVQAIMYGFSGAMNIRPVDRMYACLPLYHTTGCAIAVGAPLVSGASVVIREKFSARQFWDDVVDNQCTLIEYIGEMCRYLLNSPPHPRETAHRIRLACGNGLRPDIWEAFRDRFRIPKILEWYAATEGNAVFFNFDGRVGSVGRIPKWAERRFVTEVVRYDMEAEAPVRGADGHCIKCKPNEIGEVISKILDDPLKPSQRFEGYSDRAETERKVLRDVFEPGDMWFRTGDLMRKDGQGYFFFMDRIGDTFRWKGENVATSEVSESITTFPHVRDACVYGVRIGSLEGRAGMAALVVDDDIDLAALRRHIYERLPRYARPLFLRIQREIEVTGTFKQRKVDLVTAGFDPEKVDEPLYFDHPDREAYVSVDKTLAETISSGALKL